VRNSQHIATEEKVSIFQVLHNNQIQTASKMSLEMKLYGLCPCR